MLNRILWWPVCAISAFRLFAAKRRHAKIRKDEKTSCEKTKNAMQKDEKMKCEKTKSDTRKDEISARKDEKRHAKTPFETLILSSFRVASFRLFAWRLFVFSSFRVALLRLVVFSHGVFSSFRGEKTPCEKTK